MKQQPKLSFWQIWNVSFGFLGVQFGFALQNANVSRILSDLGADLHSLSLFWLVAPIMGLIIQPIVGSASDHTWNGVGRRNPYILGGAAAAAVAMCMMPNAPLFVQLMSPMIFGAVMLALMDASFNVAFQPFRSLVSDMVPAEQRNQGYSVQSLLINVGAIIGSILPFVLTNVVGLENAAKAGEVAPSVTIAFYIGATIMLGTVLWTVYKTREYPPEEYYAYKGLDPKEVQKQLAAEKKLSVGDKIKGFFGLMKSMPTTMKQLAVVQFFSWFALFIMWVYTMPAITQNAWGLEAKWFDSHYLESLDVVPAFVGEAKGAAGDWVGILFAAYSLFAAIFSVFLTKIANKIGRKLTYSLSLLAGGIGYMSFILFNDPTPVQANLLITTVEIPTGALNLVIPMIGIGIAWAAILAMPYAILAGSLPPEKTGVYMGIFNFTIAAPQIVSGLFAGWILSSVFDNNAIYIIMLAGAAMILGAISVVFVKDDATESVPEPTDTSRKLVDTCN
ncbi:MFS transporter [Saccharobesus litoralis]|uniref:MFS transporter n=1 Tax=Saccharobesus litoralis TaxID=2172099 RepID=A0A2S0VQM5_9ALTE|nr:MFS transporter [Saccharobesus litoralis]AWB66390.1 MFS transporter [Saccharobesus litoralis]